MNIKQLINNFKQNKVLFTTYNVLLYGFAMYGFVLVFTFFGIKLHLFNDPGGVDRNDRFFELNEVTSKTVDSNNVPVEEASKFMHELGIVHKFYPKNADLVYLAYMQHQNVFIAQNAVEAIKIRLAENQEFQNAIQNSTPLNKINVTPSESSAFEWMNVDEWGYFKEALLKDKKLIDSVAKLTDVDHRMIVAAVVGEQMRLFNSKRETFKNVIRPLKILSVESKFSLGVTGIKEFNAILVEKHLKDPTSEFYCGKKYENLLNFKTTDPTTERVNRLVDYRNHFWSYMYAAIIIKQFESQWKRAGYDISNRPEILITLFNVGIANSHPNPNPKVGGSRVNVNGINYTFGSLGYEFYYSGEMVSHFPYKNSMKTKNSNNISIEYSKPKAGPAPGSQKPDSNKVAPTPTDSVQPVSASL